MHVSHCLVPPPPHKPPNHTASLHTREDHGAPCPQPNEPYARPSCAEWPTCVVQKGPTPDFWLYLQDKTKESVRDPNFLIAWSFFYSSGWCFGLKTLRGTFSLCRFLLVSTKCFSQNQSEKPAILLQMSSDFPALRPSVENTYIEIEHLLSVGPIDAFVPQWDHFIASPVRHINFTERAR